jgi:hypothetical protein
MTGEYGSRDRGGTVAPEMLPRTYVVMPHSVGPCGGPAFNG